MSPYPSALARYVAKQRHNDTGIDRSLAALVPDRLVDAARPQSATSRPVGMWGTLGAENQRQQKMAVINE
jgi:hypothetical protein